MSVLNGKIAIVTGASSGIGRATAKLFAQEGAKVVVAARRQAELDALVQEIEAGGGQAIAVAGDVTDEAYAKALVDAAVESVRRPRHRLQQCRHRPARWDRFRSCRWPHGTTRSTPI